MKQYCMFDSNSCLNDKFSCKIDLSVSTITSVFKSLLNYEFELLLWMFTLVNKKNPTFWDLEFDSVFRLKVT